MTYAVPTQLASLDLLKSEDIEGNTKICSLDRSIMKTSRGITY